MKAVKTVLGSILLVPWILIGVLGTLILCVVAVALFIVDIKKGHSVEWP